MRFLQDKQNGAGNIPLLPEAAHLKPPVSLTFHSSIENSYKLKLTG
jgi:hypothetical protein